MDRSGLCGGIGAERDGKGRFRRQSPHPRSASPLLYVYPKMMHPHPVRAVRVRWSADERSLHEADIKNLLMHRDCCAVVSAGEALQCYLRYSPLECGARR